MVGPVLVSVGAVRILPDEVGGFLVQFDVGLNDMLPELLRLLGSVGRVTGGLPFQPVKNLLHAGGLQVATFGTAPDSRCVLG